MIRYIFSLLIAVTLFSSVMQSMDAGRDIFPSSCKKRGVYIFPGAGSIVTCMRDYACRFDRPFDTSMQTVRQKIATHVAGRKLSESALVRLIERHVASVYGEDSGADLRLYFQASLERFRMATEEEKARTRESLKGALKS